MTRIKTVFIAVGAAFTLTAGLSFAQGLMPNRPDPAVVAAQESLEEAMVALQKARNPTSSAITRAKAYIALAHTELSPAGGVQGLNE